MVAHVDGVAVIIPAKDEAARIQATVRGAAGIAGVDLVVVVDDGSTDSTGELARAAGAFVASHTHNRGKAAAMTTGAAAVARLELDAQRGVPRCLLFLDADLEETAAAAEPLTHSIVADEADMSIAVLPRQSSDGGGHGFVVQLASDGIVRATGWTPTQPLSGQRCLTRSAFSAALPLASGFGVEVGLTIDLLRQGYRVTEVEVPFHHRVTGRDWRSQVHRGRQYVHVARALASRRALLGKQQAGPADDSTASNDDSSADDR